VVQVVADIEANSDLVNELMNFCRAHLSHQKCPRSIDFEAELPRLPTGKLYKRVLRDRYWEAGEPGSYEEQAANPAGMEDGMTENRAADTKYLRDETLSMPLVRFEHLGNMARIILARPNAGNAINAALISDLSAAVDAVRACEPRSVLIAAEGANFSLGGDLKHLLAAGSDVAAELDGMAHGFHAAQLRLIGIGVPIVAAGSW